MAYSLLDIAESDSSNSALTGKSRLWWLLDGFGHECDCSCPRVDEFPGQLVEFFDCNPETMVLDEHLVEYHRVFALGLDSLLHVLNCVHQFVSGRGQCFAMKQPLRTLC